MDVLNGSCPYPSSKGRETSATINSHSHWCDANGMQAKFIFIHRTDTKVKGLSKLLFSIFPQVFGTSLGGGSTKTEIRVTVS